MTDTRAPSRGVTARDVRVCTAGLIAAGLVTAVVGACSGQQAATHVGSNLRDESDRVPSESASSAAPPMASVSSAPTSSSAPPVSSARKSAIPPPPVAPPVERTAKAGDGVWSTLAVSGVDPSPFATTIIHPHKIKPFVIAAVVAIDLSRASLGLVAGVEEPLSDDVPRERRTGLVPKDQIATLLAAMNGGFKRRHGQHGLKIGADLFVPPKDDSCTIALTSSGALRIGTWSRLAANEADFAFYRQGPPCLVEDGSKNEETAGQWTVKKWGASETGDRDIRRSVLALSKDGETLYFGIGDWINPETLADAMVAVGVEAAVQLDINYSFTRFVLYGRGTDGEPVASSPLLPKLKFSTTEYWKEPSFRDFFFLTKK